MPTHDNLTKAMSALYAACPFDASILHTMKLHHVQAPHQCTTAATDCKSNVWINLDFFEKLNYQSMLLVIAHECRHKVFQHTQRRQATGRDAQVDNWAADFIINNGLLAEGHKHQFKPMSMRELVAAVRNPTPPDPKAQLPMLADPSIDPTWGTAEVYDWLMKNLPPPQGGGGGGDGKGDGKGDGNRPSPRLVMSDDVEDGDGEPLTPEEAAEVQAQIMEAYATAKAQGRLPSGLTRVIDDLSRSRTDWREKLRNLVQQASGSGEFATDWSYRRPSRRYTGSGPLMPSILKPPTGDICIVIDTSGSIGRKELNVFGAEVRKIHEDLRPTATHIIWCDADVAGTQVFAPHETIELHPKGGGGTDMAKGIAWARKNVARPMAVVVLTDGHTSYDFKPDLPCALIWAMTTDVRAPFGEHVRVDLTI